VGSWKRRLSDDERSVLLSELLLRHPELAAEAEEITSALLVVDDRELTGEITSRLRTSPGGRNAAPGGRPPASRPPSCSGCTNAARIPIENMLLVRMGLSGAADDLARTVYDKVRPLHLSLPPLADECPEWAWYEESWRP
jgi:hypothetical protein